MVVSDPEFKKNVSDRCESYIVQCEHVAVNRPRCLEFEIKNITDYRIWDSYCLDIECVEVQGKIGLKIKI